MTAQQAPQPLTVPELLEVLAALGAPATVPADLDDADAVLHLSHGLVGAAEHKAMEAELAVRANGAQRSGPCHQPQTGLLFLVSGASEISPETGRAAENGVSPTS